MDQTSLPRFHPLIAKHNGIIAWWICDGHNQKGHHLLMPCIPEPCIDENEARELCDILNEEDNA